MKTYLPVLGGLLTVGFLATLGVGIVELPIITGLAMVGLGLLVVAGAFFYLGYTFTRDIIGR